MKANKVMRLITGILSAIFSVLLIIGACTIIKYYAYYSSSIAFAGGLTLLISIADCVFSILLSVYCNKTTYTMPIVNLSINGFLFLISLVGVSRISSAGGVLDVFLTLANCVMLIVIICLTNNIRKSQNNEVEATTVSGVGLSNITPIGNNVSYTRCSECGYQVFEEDKFCPNCGICFDEGQEDIKDDTLENDNISVNQNEAIECLKRLKELLDSNLITEEEYQEKRKKYIDSI